MQRKNKIKSLNVLLFSILLFWNIAHSQGENKTILTYKAYLEIVQNQHPLAKQANLKLAVGNAKVLYAKGAFDPKLYGEVSQKYFNGTQYYSNTNSGLKIPTWFGLELNGGYEQNQGLYLNPENSNPNAGLIYAGVSLTVGQGLFIDKRRAELKKAKLMQQNAEVERQIALNKLIYDAGKAYWNWFASYHSLLVLENAQQLAQERFEAVKQGATLGDRPYVDTLEAGIQVQNRKFGVQQLQLQFKNNSALVSIYLWENGVIPLELAEGTIPELLNKKETREVSLLFQKSSDTLLLNHPLISQQRNKIKQLEIDQKWKKEQLKPIFNLKYNPITEPINGEPLANYSINNYTWGLGFKMPILLRKERGALQLTNLKIQETNLQLENKQAILEYKFTTSLNNWYTSIQQIELYSQTVEDYFNLLKAEKQLFDEGESSLFMVNSREVGYIQTELKLIELVAKNRKAKLSAEFAYGQIF